MTTATDATQAEQLMIEGVMQQVQQRSHKAGGTAKLLSASTVVMALALPIGIFPRIAQDHELNRDQVKAVETLPAVSTARPQSAPEFRSLTLPGSIEGLQDTAVYAR